MNPVDKVLNNMLGYKEREDGYEFKYKKICDRDNKYNELIHKGVPKRMIKANIEGPRGEYKILVLKE